MQHDILDRMYQIYDCRDSIQASIGDESDEY